MANDSERMRDPMSQPNDEDYARVAELQQPAPELHHICTTEHCIGDCVDERNVPAPELLREDELKIKGRTGRNQFFIPAQTGNDIALLFSRLREARAELERYETALKDARAALLEWGADPKALECSQIDAALRGEGS